MRIVITMICAFALLVFIAAAIGFKAAAVKKQGAEVRKALGRAIAAEKTAKRLVIWAIVLAVVCLAAWLALYIIFFGHLIAGFVSLCTIQYDFPNWLFDAIFAVACICGNTAVYLLLIRGIYINKKIIAA